MAKESTLQRYQLLRRIENLLEGPMIFLGFLWLILLVVELAYGLNGALQGISSAIWIMFVVDFVLKFILAPYKWKYLTSNWLTAVSLLIPALRIFRAIRFLRLVRSIKLVKILSTLNRGMKSLNATMKKRAFGYVMLLTFIVLFAGAAGIYAFERSDSSAFASFSYTLWWTSMLLITVGSDAWPQTAEGRFLCLIIAIYGFAVFGYITATLATFFIDLDSEKKQNLSTESNRVKQLQEELVKLSRLLDERVTKKKDK